MTMMFLGINSLSNLSTMRLKCTWGFVKEPSSFWVRSGRGKFIMKPIRIGTPAHWPKSFVSIQEGLILLSISSALLLYALWKSVNIRRFKNTLK